MKLFLTILVIALALYIAVIVVTNVISFVAGLIPFLLIAAFAYFLYEWFRNE